MTVARPKIRTNETINKDLGIKKWFIDAINTEDNLLIEAFKKSKQYDEKFHIYEGDIKMNISYDYINNKSQNTYASKNEKYQNVGRKRQLAYNGIVIEVLDTFYQQYTRQVSFKTKREFIHWLETGEGEY